MIMMLINVETSSLSQTLVSLASLSVEEQPDQMKVNHYGKYKYTNTNTDAKTNENTYNR